MDEAKKAALDRRYARMALIWAENSYCVRRKVGALVVKNNMIISDGYNGTPTGFENICEDENNVSKPYVLHAEQTGPLIKQQRRCNALCHRISLYRMCKTDYPVRH